MATTRTRPWLWTCGDTGLVKGVECAAAVNGRGKGGTQIAEAATAAGASASKRQPSLHIRVLGAGGDVQQGQEHKRSIQAMCFAGDELMVLARRNGTVEAVHVDTGVCYSRADIGERVPVSVAVVNDGVDSGSRQFIVICARQGPVCLMPLPFLSSPASSEVVTEFKHSFSVGGDPGGGSGDIECMAVSRIAPHLIAVGGKERLLQVRDVSTDGARTFKARNVPNDELELRPRVWVRRVEFAPSSPHILCTATAYGRVRVYDTRAQLRPTMDIDVPESRSLTALAVPGAGRFASATGSLGVAGDTGGAHLGTVIVGDGRGRLQNICIRAGKAEGCFRGEIAGGVRHLDVHRTRGLLAACSLDRYVRVYDIKSRKLLQKVYMQQKQNCIAFARGVEPPQFGPVDTASPRNSHQLKLQQRQKHRREDDNLWAMLDTREMEQSASSKKRQKMQ